MVTTLFINFSDAQEQLTPKSVIEFCHNIIHQFLRCSRGANSKLGDGILMKFKLIQASIVVLIVCKNEEDPFNIESTRVLTFLSL